MANILTNKFLEDMLDPYRVLGNNGSLKVALLKDTAVGHIGTGVLTWDQLKIYECPETGTYVAGGKVVTGFSPSADFKLTANNVQWSGSTITAQFAVLYDNSNVLDENKTVLAIYDFGSPQSSNVAMFEVAFGVNGIVNLAQG